MSAVTITITLPPESEALIKRFQDMPQELPRAIKRGMDRALPIVAGRIVEKRLSGKGPYPPILHQLGEKIGQLRRSVHVTPAVIRGNEVTGVIGSPVRYAKTHEFGWSGYPKYKSGILSLRTFPERAPFRTGVNENASFISEQIMTEIQNTVKR